MSMNSTWLCLITDRVRTTAIWNHCLVTRTSARATLTNSSSPIPFSFSKSGPIEGISFVQIKRDRSIELSFKEKELTTMHFYLKKPKYKTIKKSIRYLNRETWKSSLAVTAAPFCICRYSEHSDKTDRMRIKSFITKFFNKQPAEMKIRFQTLKKWAKECPTIVSQKSGTTLNWKKVTC